MVHIILENVNAFPLHKVSPFILLPEEAEVNKLSVKRDVHSVSTSSHPLLTHKMKSLYILRFNVSVWRFPNKNHSNMSAVCFFSKSSSSTKWCVIYICAFYIQKITVLTSVCISTLSIYPLIYE